MTIKDRDEMKRSHSASRKACDDDFSEYTQSSYTQDKGKGRLRSEDDSKVVGEQENRNLCIRHKNMADEGTSAELQEVCAFIFLLRRLHPDRHSTNCH